MSTTEKVVFHKENPLEIRYFELQMKYQALQQKCKELDSNVQFYRDELAKNDKAFAEEMAIAEGKLNRIKEKYYKLLQENIEILEKLKQKE